MSAIKPVAVIVPFYRNMLSAYEQIALQQCFKVLAAHPIIAIKPEKLDRSAVAGAGPFTEIMSFEDHYFDSIEGYNRLMLSAKFYGRFLNYEFLLIYQLDAFVFKDELLQWCNKGYDYIGAPWLRGIEHGDWFKALKQRFKYWYHTRYDVQKDGLPSNMQFENRVGNGGLSLRRVKKFYGITQLRVSDIQRYLRHAGQHQYNEDAFWSIEANRKTKYLNIPSYQTAVGFAFEYSLERAWQLNHRRLPFGCHDWDRYTDFWRPFFKQQGYEI